MGRARPLCQETLRLCKGLDMDKRLTLGDKYSAFNMVKTNSGQQTKQIGEGKASANRKREYESKAAGWSEITTRPF